MNHEIREANPEDLKKIINLLYQLSPPSDEDKEANLNELKQILDKITKDENYSLCVFDNNGEIFGCGLLLIQMNISHGGHPYGHIETIVVDVNHRKKGVGKKIVTYLIEKAREKKCYKVVLDCKKDNIPFYGKCGLSKTGEVSMRINFN